MNNIIDPQCIVCQSFGTVKVEKPELSSDFSYVKAHGKCSNCGAFLEFTYDLTQIE